MGICCSSPTEADTSYESGNDAKNISGSENDNSNSKSKVTPCSILPTLWNEGEILQSSNMKSFTLNELQAATGNFDPNGLLGQGSFGSVFKGWVDEQSLAASYPDSGIVIGVKRLTEEGYQGHPEWLAEIKYLGKLRHPNLVKLIGYCSEDEHRLLVYEYMPEGSLDSHLFRRKTDVQPLSWSQLLNVAIGAAKGLAFLHNAEPQVIHRDFKTSNILLDSGFNAKLSDFGIARDGPTGDNTHVSTRFMGTYGYTAPEYEALGRLTAKCDVYSYGVVLQEILFCQKTIDRTRPGGEYNLVEWARPHMTNKRSLSRVLDSRIEGQSTSSALKVANLVVECLRKEPKLRPSMDKVVTTLEKLQRETSGIKAQGKSSWPF